MPTITDIVTRAYRLLGVVAADEPVSADQITSGVEAYNAMVASWVLEGIDFSESAMDAGSEFALGAAFQNSVTKLLANELASEFGLVMPYDPAPLKRGMYAALTVIPEVEMPDAILLTRRGTNHARY